MAQFAIVALSGLINPSMKITFLTECNKNIGLGHLMRSLSIANAYKLRGYTPGFIIDGNKNLSKFIDSSFVTNFFNWTNDIDKLNLLIDKTDVLFIDSISISKSKYRKIINSKKNIVFIDDYHRWGHSKGIIVDWTVNAKNKIKTIEEVNYLVGPKYTALRKEFYDVIERKHSKKIKNILITFGGGDIRNMTPKIISYFKKNYPKININIIIGKSYKNIQEIEDIAPKNSKLIYFPGAEEMKNTMMNSDIAIASGGQTLYELARVGLPTLAIILIDNQIEDTKGWSKLGFLFNLGWWNDNKIINNLNSNMSLIEDYSLRIIMGKIGQKTVDGLGAKRIVDYTLKKY